MDYYSSDTKLSNSYTLGDLIKTSQVLAMPNTPDQQWMFDNLVLLADMCEELTSKVGPFTIVSGFRTKELQQALAAAGEPATSKISFHEAGRAIDIGPSTMSPIEFFARILADAELREKFAEIALKPAQNALHLAINVPGDARTPKITALDAAQNYVKLTTDEIESYIAPYMQSAQDALAVAEDAVSSSKLPLILAGIGLLGIFLLSSRSHAAS